MDSDRCIIISTDGHCGADIPGYKPYLPSRFHDEFDSWAANYSDAWGVIDEEANALPDRIGVSSYMSPYNWDSSMRQKQLEGQGIAAEILFPNTVPPFQPSGSITTPGPTNAVEYERRFAGIQAHNRWLADFCAEAPNQRAGIAQVFLNNIDDAINELRWAKANGLMGILLPADHFQKLVNLYYPDFFPFWAACAELEMPVHGHGVIPSEAASDEVGVGAPAVGLLEGMYYSRRGMAHLVLGGVFERFPSLKYVIAESNSAWIGPYMAELDQFGQQARVPGSVAKMFAGAAFEKLSLKPSEYIKRNCYAGSFLTAMDIEARHELGVDRVMWGADFPHHEGTSPFTLEALRLNFAELPIDEMRQMTSLAAAECYGLDLDHLQTVADRIGPTESEIGTPLRPEEHPEFPEQTVCITFADVRMGSDHGF